MCGAPEAQIFGVGGWVGGMTGPDIYEQEKIKKEIVEGDLGG